jgi:hypothetical protein
VGQKGRATHFFLFHFCIGGWLARRGWLDFQTVGGWPKRLG